MKEKDFQRKFNVWCKYYMEETSCFELKISKVDSLPFSALQEHQKYALSLSKHGKLVYKIPDLGMQNPYDSLIMVNTNAYVVVMFYKRGQKEFYLIDIDVWTHEESTSKRKSLTETRAREISRVCSF